MGRRRSASPGRRSDRLREQEPMALRSIQSSDAQWYHSLILEAGAAVSCGARNICAKSLSARKLCWPIIYNRGLTWSRCCCFIPRARGCIATEKSRNSADYCFAGNSVLGDEMSGLRRRGLRCAKHVPRAPLSSDASRWARRQNSTTTNDGALVHYGQNTA